MRISTPTIKDVLSTTDHPLARLALRGNFHQADRHKHFGIQVHCPSSTGAFQLGNLTLFELDGSIVHASRHYDCFEGLEIDDEVFQAFKLPGCAQILAVQFGSEMSFYRFRLSRWWVLVEGSPSLADEPSFFAREYTKTFQYPHLSKYHRIADNGDHTGFQIGPLFLNHSDGAVYYHDVRFPQGCRI